MSLRLSRSVLPLFLYLGVCLGYFLRPPRYLSLSPPVPRLLL